MANWWEAGEVVEQEPPSEEKWWETGEVVEAAPKGPPTRVGRRTPQPTERPRPSLSIIGDRATGFRQQVAETGMTPEERQAAVAGLIPIAAGLAAGPIIATGMRAATAVPAFQRAAPAVENLARAVESGGLAPGLAAPTRIAGGAIAGGGAAALTEPEQAATGAAIGAAVPVAGRAGAALMRPRGPTTKEVKEASQAAYRAAEAAKADVAPEQFASLTYKMQDTLATSGFNPILHPKANVAVNAFVEQAKIGQPVTLNQLDVLRRVASRAAGSSSDDERRIGSRLVRDIDDFIAESTPEAAVRELEKARMLYAQMSRSKKIEALITRAGRSKQERSAAVRSQFQKIADDERKLKQFMPAEQEVIKNLASGRYDIRMLEAMGTLAPPRIRDLRTIPGAISTAGYGGLTTFLGAPLAAAVGATGYGSRALANRLAQMQAERLAMMARGGAPSDFGVSYLPQVAPVAGVNFMAEQQRINEQGF